MGNAFQQAIQGFQNFFGGNSQPAPVQQSAPAQNNVLGGYGQILNNFATGLSNRFQSFLKPVQQAVGNIGQGVNNMTQGYQQKVQEAKQAPFFGPTNTPKAWIGKVAQDVQQRGPFEGLHDLTYPLTMSPYVRPIEEPVVSGARVLNYNLGRPSSLINNLLGQTNSQMANPNANPLRDKLGNIIGNAVQGGVAGPGVQYATNPQFRQNINQNFVQPLVKGVVQTAQSAAKLTPPYLTYRTLTKNPVSPAEYGGNVLNTGMGALNTAYNLSPLKPILGAGFGAAQAISGGERNPQNIIAAASKGVNTQPFVGEVLAPKDPKVAGIINLAMLPVMLVAGIHSGSLVPEDVVNAFKSGDINEEEAKALTEFAKNPKAFTVEKPQESPQTPPLSPTLEDVGTQAQKGTPLAGKERGFVTSVKETTNPNVSESTKANVAGNYTPKPDTQLRGEADALLSNLPANSKIDLSGVKNLDQKLTATMQEAINQDKAGNPNAAATLYNNQAKAGTEVARALRTFNFLDKMSPEAISTSIAARIQEYNSHARNPIPELTGEQTSWISGQLDLIKQMSEGKAKDMAIQNFQKDLGRMIPSSISDKAFSLWRTGLLTGLRTPPKIILSHTLSNIAESATRVVATPYDLVASVFTGERSGTPTLRGVFQGAKEGTTAAYDNLIHGYETPGTGGIQKDFSTQTHFGSSWLGKIADQYVGVISRLHGSLYKPFFGSQHLNTLFDLATTEASNQGLGGAEKEAFIQDFVQKGADFAVQHADVTDSKLSLSTPEGAGIRANQEARYTTFQNKTLLSNIASGMKRGSGNPTRYAAPFTQIPSSIAMKVIDYSPLGPIKEAAQQIAKGSFDQRALTQALGRATTGIGVIWLGTKMFQNNMIHLAYPPPGKERDLWDAKGWKENSIDIGGKSRQLGSLGSIGDLLVMGGAFAQGMKGNKKTPGSVANAALGAGVSGMQTIGTSPYMQGLNDISGLFSNPLQGAKTTFNNYAGSVIPTGIANVAVATDQLQRETNNPWDKIRSNLPFARETLAPKQNVFGQNMPRANSIVGSLFDPMYSSQNNVSPVLDELARLDQTQNSATPSKLTASQTILKQKVTLTPQQLDALNQGSGGQVLQKLDTLIVNPSYQKLTDEQKATAINNLVSTQRTIYKNTVGPAITTAQTPAELTTAIQSKTTIPTTQQNGVSGQYYLVDPNTGSVKSIDLTQPIKASPLTGNTTMDKLSVSAYRSDLNARIKDIYSLYQDGQLPLDQAQTEIDKLQTQYNSTNKPKAIPKMAYKKLTLPKVKISAIKGVKLAKMNSPKYGFAKLAKYKPKGVKLAKVKQPKLAVNPLRLSDYVKGKA